MHIRDLKRNLHHGFHDSELFSYSVDYVSGQLCFKMGILCNEDDDDEKICLVKANLFFYNTLYFVADFPWQGCFCSNSTLGLDGETDIDLFLDNHTTGRACQIPHDIPEGYFTVSVYMNYYDSYLYFAANDAALEWTEVPPLSLRNINFS